MVSIITPIWNQSDITEQYLNGLLETRVKSQIPFELILVNNGSTDGTAQMLNRLALTKKFDWVKVIFNDKNLGFSGGNNQGVGIAKGDFLLFMNNDVVFNDTNWLDQLLIPFRDEPRLLVGSQLVKDNDYTIVRGKRQSYINGWCMLMKRELFEAVGGFDSGFGLGWFEDVWFSKRAEDLGFRLYEQPVNITHLGSKTISGKGVPKDKMMVRAQSYYHDKVIKSQIKPGFMRIVFVCASNYQFSDGSLDAKGVGGAESALIQMTRELAKMGHTVDVYNKPELIGLQNGVNYFPIRDFNYSDFCDVCIIWRNPIDNIPEINASLKVFFSCDQYTVGDFRENAFPFVDWTIAISPYHKKYLMENYGQDGSKIKVFDLGVEKEKYIEPTEKVKNQLIYCSVPERGLRNLVRTFPQIRERVPDATLIVTSDYTLWGVKDPGNKEVKSSFENMKGVKFLGKVPRNVLIELQKKSVVMAYPCCYDENFCISAAECIAAGAVPVTTNIGAMKTTVGDCGIVLEGNPNDPSYDGQFVDSVVKLLTDDKLREDYVKKGRERLDKDFNWTDLALKYHTFFDFEARKNMINLKQHLSGLEPFEKLDVLDLGCGDYSSMIAEQVPIIPFNSITGIEVFERDLNLTKKKEFKAKNTTWVQQDILSWVRENKNKRFDLITLYDVLEHFTKEDGLELVSYLKEMKPKRILMFMPIGKNTLEANDGRVVSDNNPYQKHLSQWEKREFEHLGFDVEFFEGFHHSGKLDAGWIIKDYVKGEQIMVTCDICGQTFNSTYFLGRHRAGHQQPNNPKTVTVASVVDGEMPDVKLTTKKPVDLSINRLNVVNEKEFFVPYSQVGDIIRILIGAYGEDIIVKQEFS